MPFHDAWRRGASATMQRMWIMIAGPYSTGARTDDERAENLRTMNRVALEVYRRGHVPIIGVNLALPVIEVAGPEAFDELMMPLSLRRCGAHRRAIGRRGRGGRAHSRAGRCGLSQRRRRAVERLSGAWFLATLPLGAAASHVNVDPWPNPRTWV
jgi:hypothetical protein